jgi:hypothetical protein
MTIPGLDPSGELGRLFFQIQSKSSHEKDIRQPQPVGWRRTFARILLMRPNCLMFERTEFNRSKRRWLRGVSWRPRVSWLTQLLGRRF